MAPETQNFIKLPYSVSTKKDLSSIIRELEELDAFLHAGAIRQPGSSMTLPKTSNIFEQIVSENKMNMLNDTDRKNFADKLKYLNDNAPIMHISFASEPSVNMVAKLTEWLRVNIDQNILLQIGLQPNIGAGCMVRTTNKYFDLSLKKHFNNQKTALVQLLKNSTNDSGEIV